MAEGDNSRYHKKTNRQKLGGKSVGAMSPKQYAKNGQIFAKTSKVRNKNIEKY